MSASPLIRQFAALALLLGTAVPASAFCGFYVGKADASLFNEASKVVMVRDGDRTTITTLEASLNKLASALPT